MIIRLHYKRCALHTLNTISSNIFNDSHPNYTHNHRWRVISTVAGLMFTWCMNYNGRLHYALWNTRRLFTIVSFAFFGPSLLFCLVLSFVLSRHPINVSVFDRVIFNYFMPCAFAPIIFTRVRHLRVQFYGRMRLLSAG